MARDLTAGLSAELAASARKPVFFVKAEFASGTLRMCSLPYDLSWEGQTWLGAGGLLGISDIDEAAQVRESQVTVSLAANAEIIALALAQARTGQDCSIWLGMMTPVSYLSLPGVAGNYASTPDSAAVSVTGDIDIRVKVAPDDWTPAEIKALVYKRLTTGNQRSFRFDLNTNGTLRLFTSADGITEDSAQTSSVATGFTDGTTHWLRATRAAATGLINYYTSEDGIDWTLLGDANRTSNAGNIFDSTEPLVVGGGQGGTTQMFAGEFYRAQLYDGIAGTLVADLDPLRMDANTLTGTMETGEAWTALQSGTPPARIVREAPEIVADPYLAFEGRLDVPRITPGETPVVAITYGSRLRDLERPRELRITHEDLQRLFSGDLGREYVAELQDKTIQW